ncbi:MAG TPA: hypothetical protein PKE01_07635, partial [Rhodocyclaceae bacterium]|nr:hypothetical protein [Rhodocyclaceae bacterium]
MAAPHDRPDAVRQDPYSLLEHCLTADRPALRRDLRRLPRRPRTLEDLPEALRLRIADSAARRIAREQARPRPDFPDELPVNQRRDEIAAAIRDHQVVIVCGETGSGKTTQLPKICLELGRGVAGLIGH